jgi:hypothetical protein
MTLTVLLVVVSVHECTHPQTGFLHALDGSHGVVRRPVFTVRNSDSDKGLSLLTLGLEMDLSTSSNSRWLSRMAALADPLP